MTTLSIGRAAVHEPGLYLMATVKGVVTRNQSRLEEVQLGGRRIRRILPWKEIITGME